MILLLLVALAYVCYLDASRRYKKTDYYKATKKSLAAVLSDKGCYGEYSTYLYLKSYEEDGAKFLYNCYLPKDNDQTTEVDIMMIHKSGIYVFESKNYSGWIFGSEYSRNWTQTLPNGRKALKEHFLNPIMQNKLHIKWLEKQIGENYLIYSIIVFSERCELKKIDISSSNIFVINRNNIFKTVKTIEERNVVTMSQEQVEDLYTKLYPFTQVTEDIKNKHIEDIRDAHSEVDTGINNNVIDTTKINDEPTMCPRCGGKLVLRVAERGAYAGSQFYGCSNFPKCRYMKDCNE